LSDIVFTVYDHS